MRRVCDLPCRILFLLLCFALLPLGCALAEDDRAAERKTMVSEQIVARGVKDPATLAAMRAVPRHKFVPLVQTLFAYDDRPLPIGHGQTISQPFIVAYMTEIIHPGPGMKVLEIGTGSGYQAAILAATGTEVYTIEILPGLAESAAKNLRQLGYDKVKTKVADGYYGWAEHAPFDAIIVTAAAEFVPPPLIEQLKDAGLMIIPVGSPFFVQTLMLVQKQGETITSANLMPVRFVPFRRAE
ncbi:MAG: protein-L-isoaspartate(D-aspartate) O-methyltransferase [Desulfuromonadales bacterium]|nr:protein-L-isoaspartate(D-aspartate) O-methyltransferase [Desulfuromonadales bacterium]